MDENTGRTPHSEEPAEGAADATPEHNTAPDGQNGAGDRDGGAQGAAQGGAIQGDSAHGESPHGAIQGDANPDRGAHLGGDATTEEQLDADTEVDRDTLRTLDPDDSPA